MASFFFIDDHPTRAGRKQGVKPGAPAETTRTTGAPAAVAADPAQTVSLDPAHGQWTTTSTLRKEVQPPTLFTRSEPQWRRWMTTAWHWLWDDEDLEEHPRVLRGLNQVKAEFLSVVWDLQSYAATNVRESITQSRSLRELWHLRATVFSVIATHRGQAEATRRLESLDEHFPVRISAHIDASAGRTTRW